MFQPHINTLQDLLAGFPLGIAQTYMTDKYKQFSLFGYPLNTAFTLGQYSKKC